LIRILGIALAVSMLVNVLGGIALKRSYVANGKLENANAALTAQLREARDANRERATIDRDIHSRPDNELFDGLR
jgi:hypothetical protein